VIYEVLGGTLSPLALRSAGGPTMRYTPLSTLSEEGNEVLKKALDPARSFPTAQEFCDALSRLDGLQIRRHESKTPPVPAKSAASRAPASVQPKPAPPMVPSIAPASKKHALGVILGGVGVVIVVGAAIFFLTQKPKPADAPEPNIPAATPGSEPAITSNGQPPAAVADNPPPTTPAPATPPPAPTRQDLLKSEVSAAEKSEEQGDWEKSLAAWLQIAQKFPESGVGRNHLETMLDHLRSRPSPITAPEFQELRPLITEAAQLDILSAMVLLGDNLRNIEPETAAKWFGAASAKGDGNAATQLGFMLETGVGTSGSDFPMAVKYFQMAADKGDIGGKFALGRCYLTGRGLTAKDEKRGIELVREAADAGDTRAINLLGDCYAHGTGVKTDYTEALRLFSRAAERGNLKALGNLGVLYMTGRGFAAPNPKKAAELFQKGALAGESWCMFNFAQCLDEGLGVGKNGLQAQSWYRKAAEAGDERAIDWCRKNTVLFTPK
jgi:TPR repeat protein